MRGRAEGDAFPRDGFEGGGVEEGFGGGGGGGEAPGVGAGGGVGEVGRGWGSGGSGGLGAGGEWWWLRAVEGEGVCWGHGWLWWYVRSGWLVGDLWVVEIEKMGSRGETGDWEKDRLGR